MATPRNFTSSGSKSRDTRGSEPSQDDVRDELQEGKPEVTPTADSGGTGVRGARGTPGRSQHP